MAAILDFAKNQTFSQRSHSPYLNSSTSWAIFCGQSVRTYIFSTLLHFYGTVLTKKSHAHFSFFSGTYKRSVCCVIRKRNYSSWCGGSKDTFCPNGWTLKQTGNQSFDAFIEKPWTQYKPVAVWQPPEISELTQQDGSGKKTANLVWQAWQ